MALDEMELHDANLIAVRLDPPTRTMEVDIEWYPDPKVRSRVPATILFGGVSDVSMTVDFLQLSHHARSGGNVVYWEPPPERRTVIHLVAGCLSIASETVEIKPEEPGSAP